MRCAPFPHHRLHVPLILQVTTTTMLTFNWNIPDTTTITPFLPVSRKENESNIRSEVVCCSRHQIASKSYLGIAGSILPGKLVPGANLSDGTKLHYRCNDRGLELLPSGATKAGRTSSGDATMQRLKAEAVNAYACLKDAGLYLDQNRSSCTIADRAVFVQAWGVGTAGWLLGVNDLKLSHPPPIVTVPLGTRNNLPFAFGCFFLQLW
ncbi:hypothetical protein L2E82_30727 [Cichorium intybus]|uniref:Uncharacterized protein n=1 Tax=Cichorium intybus TaxID=13427 RepID=A0ACB9D158_CICIN|nr:hypothetical protein L2E82_30727 [Cichorium intybus]